MADAPFTLSRLRRFFVCAALTIVSLAAHPQSPALSAEAKSGGDARLPADSTSRPLICPQPIHVALYDIVPFFDPEHDTGIDRDVITALQERTHCQFDLVFESRVRIWKMLTNGALDMTVSGIATPERREFADFVPYYRARNVLIMTATVPPPATPEAFLANNEMKLGVVKSYVHGPGWDEWISKLRNSGRVIEIADTRELFRQLDLGHVQAIPVWQPVSAAMSKRYPTQHRLILLPWFKNQPEVEYCLVLSKGRVTPELRKLIAENMAAMRKDDSLRKIYRRYLNDEDTGLMLLP
jgi:polar amino acid transport system substrate-binding protein